MADEKTKPNRQTKLSSEDPVEGRRDVPANNSQDNKRKYDVDKVEYSDTSAEDPTEDRPDAHQAKRR